MRRWLELPALFVFPAIRALPEVVLATSFQYRRDQLPFNMVSLIFVDERWPFLSVQPADHSKS